MIFTIQDAKASASIDSLGAQLISYQDAEGQEYIWQRDPKYWANCSPILFPAVGRVRNGKTLIDGPRRRWFFPCPILKPPERCIHLHFAWKFPIP